LRYQELTVMSFFIGNGYNGILKICYSLSEAVWASYHTFSGNSSYISNIPWLLMSDALLRYHANLINISTSTILTSQIQLQYYIKSTLSLPKLIKCAIEHDAVLSQTPGQHLRSKIDSFQNANFLISHQTLWCYQSLESSRRDNFNECHIIGIGWEMRKLSWKQFCSLFLNCSPETLPWKRGVWAGTSPFLWHQARALDKIHNFIFIMPISSPNSVWPIVRITSSR